MTSQRGLSGTRNIRKKKSRAGTVSAPNIQRQPVCPFQEARISAAVAPAATGRAMSQLATWAARMPMTMVSWLTETSLPRISAGAISAMYMGERLEARPMPTPPTMRKTTKTVKSGARAVQTAETVKNAPARMRSRLRPKRSERPPETSAPMRQPTRALDMAQPICDGVVRSKNFS